jgi:hypothetical protein
MQNTTLEARGGKFSHVTLRTFATTKREPYCLIMASKLMFVGMVSAVTLTLRVGLETVSSFTTFKLVFSRKIRYQSFSENV